MAEPEKEEEWLLEPELLPDTLLLRVPEPVTEPQPDELLLMEGEGEELLEGTKEREARGETLPEGEALTEREALEVMEVLTVAQEVPEED